MIRLYTEREDGFPKILLIEKPAYLRYN